MAGTLFVVGTPIGNLADLSPRARDTLAAVDLVAAEDTRRTGRLLQGLGIRVPMLSVFEGNERDRVPEVVAALAAGDVALVSDGGMPLVSDPGFRLVRAAAAAGHEVRVVPGPSAAVAALVVSGLPTDRWAFEGFLPRRAGDRAARLASIAADPRTSVLFESPKRVAGLVASIAEAMGEDRPVAVCRELTKLHETTLRGTAGGLAAALASGPPPKGEVAVVIGGAAASAGDLAAAIEDARADAAGGARPREAARAAAARHGVRANEVYAALTSAPP